MTGLLPLIKYYKSPIVKFYFIYADIFNCKIVANKFYGLVPYYYVVLAILAISDYLRS
jgi:hypothetical protein